MGPSGIQLLSACLTFCLSAASPAQPVVLRLGIPEYSRVSEGRATLERCPNPILAAAGAGLHGSGRGAGGRQKLPTEARS